MGRKASFSYQEFAQAADELKYSGVPVTVRAVQEKLGGGSMTTISSMLKEWNAQQPAVEPAADLKVSPALAVAFEGELNKRIEGLRSEYQKIIASLKAEIEGWTQENGALENRISEQLERIAELEIEKIEWQGERRVKDELIAKLEAELKSERERRVEKGEEAAAFKAIIENQKNKAPAEPAPKPKSLESASASSAADTSTAEKRILELNGEGLSVREIAAKLAAEGIKTAVGKNEWNPGTISKIIKRIKN